MRITRMLALGATALGCWACSGTSGTLTGLQPNQGQMVVKLTDAPFSTDSVQSVDVFVVRIDGRTQSATDADAAASVDQTSSLAAGWTTVAQPNAKFNLLTLTGGTSATIGQTALTAGTYQSLRLILDVSQSSITLKNGTVLTATSTPSILFPSAGQSGIKIQLASPIVITGGATTTVLVDFDVGNSFVLRGNTILQNGLLFTPVINATVQ
jgi:uncharacterized protein DUF4382